MNLFQALCRGRMTAPYFVPYVAPSWSRAALAASAFTRV